MEQRITEAEFNEYISESGFYRARLQSRAGVLDLTQVTSFEVSSQTISTLAERAFAFSDPNWLRIVIAPTPPLFGLARMFQLRGAELRPNLHVVHTTAEAWALLSLEKEPKFGPLEGSS